MVKDIQALTAQNILSVYSGKAGACCCGCKGKHYYASYKIEEGRSYRGYEVMPDEINDKMVIKVLRMIQANEDKAKIDEEYICVGVGARTYIAYLCKSTTN